MIHRIYRSKSDIESLSRVKTTLPTGVDRYDYKGKVVHKPWGYEYLLYENPFVSIWILHLKENQSTSMHCHPNKKTSLVVLRGEVLCSTLEGFFTRKAGDGLIIETAVFHTTKATSRGGALIMELETPPNKRDLVRLKDAYGREGQHYEGTDQMTRETKEYEYVDFHGKIPKKRLTRILGRCRIDLCFHESPEAAHRRLHHERAPLICLLSGTIFNSDGLQIVSPGEAIETRVLQKISRIRAFHAIMYLAISPYGKIKKTF
jgi:mannose-6-phosphate isomerase-like protein (cupin superfamily)